MEYIEIQYKDGRDERIDGDSLEERWDELAEATSELQYAAHFVPKRNGDGYRARSVFGITREEDLVLRATQKKAGEERAGRAITAMHASRDWTWTYPRSGSHL